MGAARATGEEHRRGRQAPGFGAEWVAFDRDPVAIESLALLDLRVEATMVAGELVTEPDGGMARGYMGQRGLQEAARAVASAKLVVAATGAGMSRESGIPTFRDAREGLWARYDPTDLATRDGFRCDPARVWGWYNYRRGLIAGVEPHAGHRALAELEGLVPRVAVATQNIDGMHRMAGSREVYELHGNINRFKCFAADHPVEDEIPVLAVDGKLEPPVCRRCGSPVRPDVVWFGEPLPPGVFDEAERLASVCEVMLVVGTSGIVYPAAMLPATAREAGAIVVEVNVERSEITVGADVFLRGPAGEVLPRLVSHVRNLVS